MLMLKLLDFWVQKPKIISIFSQILHIFFTEVLSSNTHTKPTRYSIKEDINITKQEKRGSQESGKSEHHERTLRSSLFFGVGNQQSDECARGDLW
jgi:hypothetical protein